MSVVINPYLFGGDGVPAGGHRYWRLFCTENGGNAYTTVAELELRETEGGPNVATGGTPISGGSGADDTGPSNAFDGNTGTQWARSSASNTWVGYDFGAGNKKDIIEISVTHNVLGQAVKNCTFDYSDDGLVWETLFSFDAYGWITGVSKVFPEPEPTAGEHRFWRMFAVTNNGHTSTTALAEIQFRATVSGSDQCSGGRAIGSAALSGGAAANAFDDNASTFWSSSGASNVWVGYIFPEPVGVEEVLLKYVPSGNLTRAPKSVHFDYSDDEVTWTTAYTPSDQTGWTLGQERLFTIP